MNAINNEGIVGSLPSPAYSRQKSEDNLSEDFPPSERVSLANVISLDQRDDTLRFHPSRNRPRLYSSPQNKFQLSFQGGVSSYNSPRSPQASLIMPQIHGPRHTRINSGNGSVMNMLIPIADDEDDDMIPQEHESHRDFFVISPRAIRLPTYGIDSNANDTSRNIHTLTTQANLHQQTVQDLLVRNREPVRHVSRMRMSANRERENIDNAVERNQAIQSANVELEMRAFRQGLEIIRERVKFYIALTAVFSVGLLVLKDAFSYRIAFSVFWVGCLYQFMAAFKHKQGMRLTPQEKKQAFFDAFESFVMGIFLAAALVKIEGINTYLSPFVIFGLITSLFSLIYFGTYKIWSTVKLLSLIKILAWVELCLVALKADNFISDWAYVFYPPFYISLVLMIGSVLFLLMSVFYVISQYRTDNFRALVFGHIWDFVNSLASWAVGFICLGLLELIKNDNDKMLSISLIAGIGCGFGLIVYTIFFHTQLQRYVLIPLLARERFKLNKTINQQKFDVVNENLSYLIQISPSYFVEMTNRSRIKDKQQARDWQQQIKAIKARHQTQRKATTDKWDIQRYSTVKKQKGKVEEEAEGIRSRSKSLIIKTKSLRRYRRENSTRLCCSLNNLDNYNDAEKAAKENNKKAEENDKQCFVCFSSVPDVVFMNCGHGGICYDCAIMAWKKDEHCVLCRKPIEKLLKVTVYHKVGVAKVMQAIKKAPLEILV